MLQLEYKNIVSKYKTICSEMSGIIIEMKNSDIIVPYVEFMKDINSFYDKTKDILYEKIEIFEDSELTDDDDDPDDISEYNEDEDAISSKDSFVNFMSCMDEYYEKLIENRPMVINKKHIEYEKKHIECTC